MKDWKMIRFYINTFIVFCIAIILLLGYIPISLRVKEEVPGVLWSLEDEEYSETVTVSIDGRYKKFLVPLFIKKYCNILQIKLLVYI